ncbi:DUF368 domain-containing protein [bacterium]|nr:DUF368 domain-containing protein [bacterium]
MTGESKSAALAARSLFGGVLMGLANLVPGISGGTMLLASGVYPAFIGAITELTTFKLRSRSLLVLAGVLTAAGLAILLLAGVVRDLVVDHRWAMYALFIGLTLGGLPVVWRLIDRPTGAVWAGAAAGAVGMATLAWLQATRVGGGAVGGSGPLALLLAGVAGASAMILPGISGGYLLLVLGQYLPILSAIERFKDALGAARWSEAVDVALKIGLPVGIGVVLGIAGVSHLLKYLLRRQRNATLGVLLGLLVGAVAGLWPFQRVEAPSHGDGRGPAAAAVAEDGGGDAAAGQPIDYYLPSAGQAALALGFVLAGVAVTMGVARIGGEDEDTSPDLRE